MRASMHRTRNTRVKIIRANSKQTVLSLTISFCLSPAISWAGRSARKASEVCKTDDCLSVGGGDGWVWGLGLLLLFGSILAVGTAKDKWEHWRSQSKTKNSDEQSGNMPLKCESVKEKNSAPLTLLVAAFLTAFVLQLFGLVTRYGFQIGPGTGTAIAEGLVTAPFVIMFFPAIHIVTASLWRSKRNKRSRRRIFLGWMLFFSIVGAANTIINYANT